MGEVKIGLNFKEVGLLIKAVFNKGSPVVLLLHSPRRIKGNNQEGRIRSENGLPV